jgi:hypothetical protein
MNVVFFNVTGAGPTLPIVRALTDEGARVTYFTAQAGPMPLIQPPPMLATPLHNFASGTGTFTGRPIQGQALARPPVSRARATVALLAEEWRVSDI